MKKIFHKRYRKHLLEPELDIPDHALLHGEKLRDIIYHKKIHSHLQSTFSRIGKVHSEALKDEEEFRKRLLDSLKKEKEELRHLPSSRREGRKDPSLSAPPFRFTPSLSLQMSAMLAVLFLSGVMGWSLLYNGGGGSERLSAPGPRGRPMAEEESALPDEQMTEKVLNLRLDGAKSREDKVDIMEKLIRFYREHGRIDELRRMEDRLRSLESSPTLR